MTDDNQTNDDRPPSVSEEIRSSLKAAFVDLPASFEDRLEAVIAIRHAFHEELSGAISQDLNEFIADQPQDSYADKRGLSSRVNEIARRIGLAVQCQKNQRAGTLLAEVRSPGDEGSSRYRIAIRNDAGRRSKGTSVNGALPPLQFVPDNPSERWWKLRADKDSPSPG